MIDGAADFDADIAPACAALPFFRRATDEEIDRSFAAYQRRDYGRLCDLWCEVAAPTRAELGQWSRFYDRAHLLPARANGLAFLATIRAVLRAGVGFRERLSAPTRQALAVEFPWLERRHQHIPDGFAPAFSFPDLFRRFIDAPSLDDARARWQLCCGLNEVEQQWYSRHAAARFGVPELARHGDRERALAVRYFSCSAPPASRELWRQCIVVLDALNAAVFDLVCNRARRALAGHALIGMVTRRAEWRAFVDGLDQPQL